MLDGAPNAATRFDQEDEQPLACPGWARCADLERRTVALLSLGLAITATDRDSGALLAISIR